jgi:hypothetical protein
MNWYVAQDSKTRKAFTFPHKSTHVDIVKIETHYHHVTGPLTKAEADEVTALHNQTLPQSVN